MSLQLRAVQRIPITHLVLKSCNINNELETVNYPGGSDLRYCNLATSSIGIQGAGQAGPWLHLDGQTDFKLSYFSFCCLCYYFDIFETRNSLTVLPASSNHALMKGQSSVVLITEMLWVMLSTEICPALSPAQPLYQTGPLSLVGICRNTVL